MSILKAMHHGKENPWTDEQRPMYSMVLQGIDDAAAKKALEYAVFHCDWRPSPAELRRIVSRTVAPYPDDDTAYAEIVYKLDAIGEWGRTDPNNSSVQLKGEPPMSHPIVCQMVRYMGGWQNLCSGESQMQEGLKKQARSAHESCAKQWEDAVSDQLRLPEKKRDPKYFRKYDTYDLPEGWTYAELEEWNPPKVIEQKRVSFNDIDPDIQDMIRGMGKSIA